MADDFICKPEATKPLNPTVQDERKPLDRQSSPIQRIPVTSDIVVTDEPAASSLSRTQPDIEQLLTEAREHIIDGEKELAFANVVKALKIDESHPEALWLYATLHTTREKAVVALKRLLAVQSDHAKARALLNKWSDEALIADKPRQQDNQNELIAQMLKNQQLLIERQQQAPVINITNANNSTATSDVDVNIDTRKKGHDYNRTAYLLGLLFGLIGILGVAYMANGRIGKGIIVLLAGVLVWLPIVAAIAATGVGAIFALLLHLAMIHSTSKSGAQYT